MISDLFSETRIQIGEAADRVTNMSLSDLAQPEVAAVVIVIIVFLFWLTKR